jgi:uncharacterized protein
LIIPQASPQTLWIVTDGKAGDEQPCLGIAEALGVKAEIRHVKPRRFYTWLMPYGPIDPQEAFHKESSPITPPFPDMVIASGRRTVPYLRAIKRASHKTFTVFLKDPRTRRNGADFIWVPEHDAVRGSHVFVTLTPPHRISADLLAQERNDPDPRLAGFTHPRVAVLVGGNSRHHHFSDTDQARFLSQLNRIVDTGATLMISPSRRTPPSLVEALGKLAAQEGGFCWDGTGDNPYRALLALSDAIVVTVDSYNMVGEACAAGVPIFVFSPSGGHPKLDRFINALQDKGIVHPFIGDVSGERFPPLDATAVIASAILTAYEMHKTKTGI